MSQRESQPIWRNDPVGYRMKVVAGLADEATCAHYYLDELGIPRQIGRSRKLTLKERIEILKRQVQR